MGRKNEALSRDEIVYGGRTYTRYPDSKYRNMRVYFHAYANGRRTTLHREVWIAAHGPIPKGFVIHHKDHNAVNNALDNLEILTSPAHMRLHALEPKRNAEMKALARKNSDKFKRRMAKWRKDNAEEFKALMKENWKHAVVPERELTCPHCGNVFKSTIPRAKFCSHRCRQHSDCKRYYEKRKARDPKWVTTRHKTKR